MKEATEYSVAELVLELPPKLDPAHFDLDAYGPFLDLLCGGRGFQEEAISATLRFLVGSQVGSTAELAAYNYPRNAQLAACYGSEADLMAKLPFPDKLACSIDLATGTGKSYVIYALARILLNEGTIDRVLVLCPSTTIEAGLLDKFRSLSGDKELREALPSRSGTKNPDIIQGQDTIEPGTICVENIHATYKGTKSAIGDSLTGHGATTLVVSDEAHHIYSPSDTGLKKWKGFLDDPAYGFKYLVGCSGTCYVGDVYFSDVIYRYSLAQAMEDGVVKKVWYVDQDPARSENEAFQKILANHEANRRTYRPLKPLTILVTKDIAAAASLGTRLASFLADEKVKGFSSDRVLVVTSHADHAENVAKLASVDLPSNPAEWIVSVSMLTEGWDVKNVFQIVPHELRAFNSKLLIAQVLGRGLRIPAVPPGQQPEVTVFNHERWASAIRHLVDEVMENDVRIASYPVPERANYNFRIHQLSYKAGQRNETVSKAKEHTGLPKGIALASQPGRITRRTQYRKAGSTDEREQTTVIKYRTLKLSEVANRVTNRLKSIDLEEGTSYSKDNPQAAIERIIRRSLRAAGETRELVSEENAQRIMAAFGPLVRRKSRQRPRLTVEVDKVQEVDTANLPSRSIGLGALRKDAAVFYDEESLDVGEERDRWVLKDLDAGHPYGSAVLRVPNPYNFKVPTNIVAASHRPERQFIRELLRNENAKTLNAWIKSPDSHFYEIEFSWRKGEHQKQGSFNPDFFISLEGGKTMLVVETKADGDVTDENRGKLKYAKQHFELLNKKQNETEYRFYLLSPQDYDAFFGALRKGTVAKFRSRLHTELLEGASKT